MWAFLFLVAAALACLLRPAADKSVASDIPVEQWPFEDEEGIEPPA